MNADSIASAPLAADLVEQPSAFAGLIGASTCDITPPIGIYARQWGAAASDIADGVHRRLEASVVAFKQDADASPLILIGADIGWFTDPKAVDLILGPICEALGIERSHVALACTHTHAACSVNPADVEKPGGELVPAYLDRCARRLIDAARQAVESVEPAVLTWAYGKCNLAIDRDLPEPVNPAAPSQAMATPGETRSGPRYVCGYNPAGRPDDTLLVGRVTRDRDAVTLAVIVNYACHPTTLAWDNHLISPDFIGTMRQLIQRDADDAAVVFMQGASGELSPAWQYRGDPAVADHHGKHLGYAVLSTLASMLPPRRMLSFQGVVESGAPLGVWDLTDFTPDRTLAAELFMVDLPLKSDLPTLESLQAELATTTDRTYAERLRRKIFLIQTLGRGTTYASPVWAWRLGDSLLFMQPNEAYSAFQIGLREAFPGRAVAVTNVTNGAMGYLPTPDRYDVNIYQAWQTPFDRGGLERLMDWCEARGRALLGG